MLVLRDCWSRPRGIAKGRISWFFQTTCSVPVSSARWKNGIFHPTRGIGLRVLTRLKGTLFTGIPAIRVEPMTAESFPVWRGTSNLSLETELGASSRHRMDVGDQFSKVRTSNSASIKALQVVDLPPAHLEITPVSMQFCMLFCLTRYWKADTLSNVRALAGRVDMHGNVWEW